ncbi:MAG: 4Fe-4S binding protein, partial [Planctomycetota bacterium]
ARLRVPAPAQIGVAVPAAATFATSLAGAGTISLSVGPPAEAAAPAAQRATGSFLGDRLDLMRFGPVRSLLRSRPFRFAVQLVMVCLFLLIIAAGLFGNQNPALNVAPLLTWTIWWGGLVVLIMFAGKAWCYMCPWDALAGWLEKLRLWKKTDAGASLGLPWPRIVRNITIATVLFVGLTWVELGFGVTMRPRATAYLAMAMLVLAVVSAFLFDRKSFCRYGCLVGRVSGLYAMFSGIEIRPRRRQVCTACGTKECVTGSTEAYGCPTFEYPGKMQTNTYCIQCAECLQACPHDNLAVSLRPWGSDLAVEGKPRRDEAYLALLMLSITGFHGLTMTPVWRSLTDGIEALLPIGRVAAFSAGMAALMGFPILIYAALVWCSYAIAHGSGSSSPSSTARQRRPVSYRGYFVRYAYCVLPIALFYHLAHNLEHLLMEGQKVIALFSDPFGWGWNLFGTAGRIVPPLVSLDVLWILQVILVGVGHVYSLWAARKISRRMFPDPRAASRGQWPMLIGMIAFSVFSLWLLKQPMEMRTSAM